MPLKRDDLLSSMGVGLSKLGAAEDKSKEESDDKREDSPQVTENALASYLGSPEAPAPSSVSTAAQHIMLNKTLVPKQTPLSSELKAHFSLAD